MQIFIDNFLIFVEPIIMSSSFVDSLKLFCSTFEEHHNMIFNILWEMVVSSDVNLQISAAHLLKVIVRISTSESFLFAYVL